MRRKSGCGRLSAADGSTDSVVMSLFKVNDSFDLPDGEKEYRVSYDEGSKGAFEKLGEALEPRGLAPWLVGSREDCVLLVRKKQPVKPSKSRIPFIMALLTFASVIVFAIVEVQVYGAYAKGVFWPTVFVEFAACVLAILASHELGHRLASRRTKTAPPTPYVIPGVPALTYFLCSLGIVSTQREPAANRDKLFDVILAGPLLTLAVAIVLWLAGGLTSVLTSLPSTGIQVVNGIPVQQANPSILQYDIASLLSPLLGPSGANATRLSPIADAAGFGFPLTFVSILPMAFFDGGFLFSTVFKSGSLRVATYGSIMLLILVDTPDYWALAIVVLLMVARPFDIQIRDEVSEISPGRRALYWAVILLAILSVPVPGNLATIPLG
jgi:hypothetical protein